MGAGAAEPRVVRVRRARGSRSLGRGGALRLPGDLGQPAAGAPSLWARSQLRRLPVAPLAVRAAPTPRRVRLARGPRRGLTR